MIPKKYTENIYCKYCATRTPQERQVKQFLIHWWHPSLYYW